MYSTTLLAAVVGLSASVRAHMTMKSPIPLNAASLTSSPLDGEQLIFPCQAGESGAYNGESNSFEAGSQQSLAFTGSAVHGGGSCQISITYDDPPPADKSKWKVIHTIIGGCPSSAAGNIPTSGTGSNGLPDGVECAAGESGECKSVFDFSVPAELPNGKVYVAWTWLNKIGNREFYMNCAAADITGGSDSTDFFDGLPEMFVANLPGECTTNEGVLEIPNPGESVQRNEDADPNALGTCTGAGSSGGSNGGSSNSPSVEEPELEEEEEEEVEVAPPSGQDGSNDGSNDGRGGIFSPITPDESADDSASPPIDSPSAGSGSGQCSQGFVSCTDPGQVVCSGSTDFGICNIDNCAKVMPLAKGMSCADGVVGATRKVRRSVRGSSSTNHGRLHYQHRRRFAGASF